MDANLARLTAERLHAGDHEEDGTPLLWHIRRVASSVLAEAQTAAWLHEALEWTAVSEQALLEEGLTSDELRALRLLHRAHASRAEDAYLAHIRLIANAAGPSSGSRAWSRSRIWRTAACIPAYAGTAGRPRMRAAWICCGGPPSGGTVRSPARRPESHPGAHGVIQALT